MTDFSWEVGSGKLFVEEELYCVFARLLHTGSTLSVRRGHCTE